MAERSFNLPDVGEGLTEAEIVTWKVAVGDTVTINQPLVDIETAKATVELPSPYEGTVVALLAAPGDVVDVGVSIITIETGGDAAPSEAAASETATAPAERTAVLVGYGVATEERAHATAPSRRRCGPRPRPPRAPHRRPPRSHPPPRRGRRRRSASSRSRSRWTSPRSAARVATGSSRAPTSSAPPARPPARASPSAGPARRQARRASPASSSPGGTTGPREERIPVRGVLRLMAESMKRARSRSRRRRPGCASTRRGRWTSSRRCATGPRSRACELSPLTILALAVCHATRANPGINSSFDEAAHEVIVRRSIALGIAAATDRGLIVPNMKDADQLDLVVMARALDALVATARAGTTTPADMLGTTLTITNVGPFGIDGAMAILPPGTAAIVAVGQIVPQPWVIDGEVVVRPVVELTVTFDHRMVDGALASTFLARLGRFLEDPAAAILGG